MSNNKPHTSSIAILLDMLRNPENVLVRTTFAGMSTGLTAAIVVYLSQPILPRAIHDRAMQAANGFVAFFMVACFALIAAMLILDAVHGRTPKQIARASGSAVGKTVLYVFVPCAIATAVLVLWAALTHHLG